MTIAGSPLSGHPISGEGTDSALPVTVTVDVGGKRDYETYLRGPATLNSFCFATVDQIRVGLWHTGTMSVFAEPQDLPPDDFGIIPGGGFTIELADEDQFGGLDGLGPDWMLQLEDGSNLILEDGSGRLIQDY